MEQKKSLRLKKITISRLVPESLQVIRGGGTGSENIATDIKFRSNKISCYIPYDDYEKNTPTYNTSVKMELC